MIFWTVVLAVWAWGMYLVMRTPLPRIHADSRPEPRTRLGKVMDANRYLHRLERDLGRDVDLETSVMLERAATLRDAAVEAEFSPRSVRRYLEHCREVAVHVHSRRL